MSFAPGQPPDDFEVFYQRFLAGHRSSGTRYAHVAAVGVGILGLSAALRRRSIGPLLLGAAGFAALAVLSHPLFEGNWPENFHRPAWAARAFARLCWQTLTRSVPEPPTPR